MSQEYFGWECLAVRVCVFVCVLVVNVHVRNSPVWLEWQHLSHLHTLICISISWIVCIITPLLWKNANIYWNVDHISVNSLSTCALNIGCTLHNNGTFTNILLTIKFLLCSHKMLKQTTFVHMILATAPKFDAKKKITEQWWRRKWAWNYLINLMHAHSSVEFPHKRMIERTSERTKPN